MDVDDSEKCFRTIKFTVFEKILIKVQKMPVFFAKAKGKIQK